LLPLLESFQSACESIALLSESVSFVLCCQPRALGIAPAANSIVYLRPQLLLLGKRGTELVL
jgi:hypothetical protein